MKTFSVAIAWLWTISFVINLSLFICGSEPLWANVLVPIGALMITSWLDAA